MNPDKFIEELSKHNIDLTEKQKKQFQLYFEDLIETNKHVNLTRITEYIYVEETMKESL